MLPIFYKIHIKLNSYWVCKMYIVKCAISCGIFYLLRIYFRIRCYYRPIAWHTVADITEFHIDFSFVVCNDRWLQWQAEFEKFMLFRYFSSFGFMRVHSLPTKIMLVDTKYKNGKQILY